MDISREFFDKTIVALENVNLGALCRIAGWLKLFRAGSGQKSLMRHHPKGGLLCQRLYVKNFRLEKSILLLKLAVCIQISGRDKP